jgi:hypothetical protein
MIVPDAIEPVLWQDVNFNGSSTGSPDPPDPPAFNYMQGFNDWANADLRQIGSQESALGFSGGGGASAAQTGGQGASAAQTGGQGVSAAQSGGHGVSAAQSGGHGISAAQSGGHGAEQDADTACATADPPSGLTATQASNKSVLLTWNAPGGPCKVKRYNIWRSTNGGPFVLIGTVGRQNNNKPTTTFADNTIKNNNIYRYFATDTDVEEATSTGSNVAIVIT